MTRPSPVMTTEGMVKREVTEVAVILALVMVMVVASRAQLLLLLLLLLLELLLLPVSFPCWLASPGLTSRQHGREPMPPLALSPPLVALPITLAVLLLEASALLGVVQPRVHAYRYRSSSQTSPLSCPTPLSPTRR
jgi:hypothetical protein